jgi:hypothetical protein
MIFEFPTHLPHLTGVRVQLEECLSFLKDTGYYGAVTLLWEDPTSKHQTGFKLSRMLKPHQSEYYRLPPLVLPVVTFTILNPQMHTAPHIQINLDEKEQVLLHKALLKELEYQQKG